VSATFGKDPDALADLFISHLLFNAARGLVQRSWLYGAGLGTSGAK
jgi:hypothetical protein